MVASTPLDDSSAAAGGVSLLGAGLEPTPGEPSGMAFYHQCPSCKIVNVDENEDRDDLVCVQTSCGWDPETGTGTTRLVSMTLEAFNAHCLLNAPVGPPDVPVPPKPEIPDDQPSCPVCGQPLTYVIPDEAPEGVSFRCGSQACMSAVLPA